MKIMLCNDDGVNAEGINVLHGLLVKKHEVFVIAPEEEKSGAGSSIQHKDRLFLIKSKKILLLSTALLLIVFIWGYINFVLLNQIS